MNFLDLEELERCLHVPEGLSEDYFEPGSLHVQTLSGSSQELFLVGRNKFGLNLDFEKLSRSWRKFELYLKRAEFAH